MKPLETVRLVEVTLVLAIETYSTESVAVCGMDYVDVPGGNDAQLIGWSERELSVVPKNAVDEYSCDQCGKNVPDGAGAYVDPKEYADSRLRLCIECFDANADRVS